MTSRWVEIKKWIVNSLETEIVQSLLKSYPDIPVAKAMDTLRAAACGVAVKRLGCRKR